MGLDTLIRECLFLRPTDSREGCVLAQADSASTFMAPEEEYVQFGSVTVLFRSISGYKEFI